MSYDDFNDSDLLGSLDLPSSAHSKSRSKVVEEEDLGPSREELLKKNALLEGEVEQLQVLIGDLSRRLQNAHHTIESYKMSATDAIRTAHEFRTRSEGLGKIYRLELNRSEMSDQKKKQQDEARKYDVMRKKCEKFHEDYRFAVIDHESTGIRREPSKLGKMRKQLEDMEAQADSQKQLLSHYGVMEQRTEELSLAAQNGMVEKCHNLLQSGVKPNHFDAAGFLPLHYAAARGHVAVARLLLEYGSDHSAYLTGYSPIELASRSGSLEIIEDLLAFGADIEETGKGGRPPLVSATASQHLQVMSLLLDNGANIDAADVKGNTALHEAVKLKEPVDFIYLLLRRGAEPSIQNVDGKNPMEVAMAEANVLALEALGGREMPTTLDEDTMGEEDAGRTTGVGLESSSAMSPMQSGSMY